MGGQSVPCAASEILLQPWWLPVPLSFLLGDNRQGPDDGLAGAVQLLAGLRGGRGASKHAMQRPLEPGPEGGAISGVPHVHRGSEHV